MNYLEALRSGKRYRRRAWHGEMTSRSAFTDDDYIERGRRGQALPGGAAGVLTERVVDLLADDWEIEEEKITVTRAEVEKAWEHAMELRPMTTFTPSLGEFLNALGFKS